MTTKAKSAYVAHATFIVAVVAAILVPWLLVPLYVVGVIYAYRGYRYDVSSPISSTWATMYSVAICWSLFDHVTQYLSVRATIGGERDMAANFLHSRRVVVARRYCAVSMLTMALRTSIVRSTNS